MTEDEIAEKAIEKEKNYNLLTAAKPRSLGTGVEYVALVDMCTTIARPEGVAVAEGGKHAAHKGLEDFMNNRGIWCARHRDAALTYLMIRVIHD